MESWDGKWSWMTVDANADLSLPGLSAKLVKSERGLSRPQNECNERLLGQRMTGRTSGRHQRRCEVEKRKKGRQEMWETGRIYDRLGRAPCL